MTVERAGEIAGSAVAVGSATAVALVKGTGMADWLLWVLSTFVAGVAAYFTHRLTTENRLTTLEQKVATTATAAQLAETKGEISAIRVAIEHQAQTSQRIDNRLEHIANRLGAA